MPTRDAIMDLLREIPDPEMPISIVDLGIVERVDIDGSMIIVDVLPTFVGCPALPMIQNDIETKLLSLPDVNEVNVNFVFDPPWSVDRITETGRASLREHGVTVPATNEGGVQTLLGQLKNVTLRTSAIACPFCSSNSTRLDSAFGPTRCRMIYYCDACRNSFEHLKRV